MSEAIDDMTGLAELSESSILQNLKNRYQQQNIYTYTGSILVALNPFASMPIYSHEFVRKYSGSRMTEHPPHIYAIAEATVYQMKNFKHNQAVIISGESGAGKTESTKLILQYITSVTAQNSGSDSRSWVDEQIVEANNVLESFGNAKTVRNNNSSRFGKFVQVLMDANFSVVGASAVNYLLEKSRVARQGQTERNYRIFYELMAGASTEERTKYMLPAKPTDFFYLNQSGCVEIPGTSDKKNFESLKLALTVLKVPAKDLEQLFRIVSAILHLGNVKFVKTDQDGSALDAASAQVVKNIAQLLECEQDKLTQALLNRRITVRNESTLVPLKKQQAEDNRDAIAKILYDKMFNYVVSVINESTATKQKVAHSIGVLDIFGFEQFEVNSFEQLCINFANEQLQQFFNSFIFKLEQDEYIKEGIPWENVKFSDNQKCLDLIQAKGGVLAILDEECKVPNGSDDSYLNKMHAAHAKNECYIKPRTSGSIFGIKHYAGEVSYTVTAFLDKNRDAVPDEIIELFKASKISVVPKIFSDATLSTEKGAKKMTAGANFKSQLESLITILNSTQPHYVRCIKPNFEKSAFKFDDTLTLSQLRTAGMLETIKVRKVGFPSRFSYEQFSHRFRLLSKDQADLKASSKAILSGCKIDPALWKQGNTKIFMKPQVVDTLVSSYHTVKVKHVKTLQNIWRGIRARRKYLLIKTSTKLLQKYLKGFVYRGRYVKKRKAIVKIQSVIRGYFARDYTRELRLAKIEAEEAARRAKEEEEKSKLAEAEKATRLAEERALEAQRSEEDRLRREEEKKLAEYKAANQKVEPEVVKTNTVDEISTVISTEKEDPDISTIPPPVPIPLTKVTSKSNIAGGQRKLKYNPLAKPVNPAGGEEVKMEEEDKSLKVYGEKHFNKHPKPAGTLASATFRKPKDFLTIEDMLMYSRVPIPMCMVKTKESENLNTIAVDVFKNLTRLFEVKGPDVYEISKKLVDVGIERPDLRDELYMQVFRQITPNPKIQKDWADVALTGWTLIAMYSNSFPPSKVFSKYLLRFVSGFAEDGKSMMQKTPVGKLADYSERSVKSIMLNGARQFAPSMLEYEYITAASPMQCRIHLLDGSYKSLTVTSSTTASDIVRDLSEKIDLKDYTGWSIFEVSSVIPWSEHLVKGSNYIADIYAIWEKNGLLSTSEPVKQKMGTISGTFSGKKKVSVVKAGAIGDGPIKLYLKRRVVRNVNELPDDPVVFKLVYYQAALDVRNDVYPITEELAIQLCALKCQAEYGDFSDVHAANLDKLEEFLPQSMVSSKKDSLVKASSVEYVKLKGTQSFQARIKYMEVLQVFKHYGSTLFSVQYIGFWQHAGNLVLSISAQGVQFMSKSKVPFESYSYKQLHTWETDAESITFNVLRNSGLPLADGNAPQNETEGSAVESFRFRTTVAEDISVLLKDYSPKVGADKKKGRDLFVAESEMQYLEKNLDKARLALLKKRLVIFGEGVAPKSKPAELADLFKAPESKKDEVIVGPVETKLGGIQEGDEEEPASAPPAKPVAQAEPPQKVSGITGIMKGLTVRGKSKEIESNGTVRVPRSPDKVNDQSSYLPEWSTRLIGLTPPLLTLFAANPSQQRTTVRLNELILEYVRMQDSSNTTTGPSKSAKANQDSTPEWVMIKAIMDACFADAKLIDELYMELMRYTANQMPPNSRQVLRVWKLFAVSIGSLRPKLPEVTELIRCHLNRFSSLELGTPADEERKDEALYAKYCLKQFPRMIQAEQRRFSPGEDEIKFIIKLSPIYVKIYLPDGQYRALSFESHTSVEELLILLKTKLKLAESGYAIYAAKGPLERSLALKESLCDVLGKWDKNSKNVGSDPSKEPRFVLKRRMFVNPDQPASTPVDEEFMMGQLINQIVQSRHPLELADAIYLAGLRAQVEDGDEQSGKKVDYKVLIEKYVSKELRNDKLVAEIQKAHVANRGKSSAECNQLFMKRIRNSSFYYSTVFDVSQSYTSDYPSSCWLIVNSTGVRVSAVGSREMIVSMPYKDMASANPDGSSIMIMNQNRDKKLVFQSVLSSQISSLIRDYSTLQAQPADAAKM